ncbi:unnamed protein product [Paramecium octaurelia]|uniref:Uncharacterized protein n=1 Tax=Paramecium octaurelia TaxID=43137 RepID=A0A8S1V3A0_PAROT|nr:unnamed protein product [Paramecium octaurelia]
MKGQKTSTTCKQNKQNNYLKKQYQKNQDIEQSIILKIRNGNAKNVMTLDDVIKKNIRKNYKNKDANKNDQKPQKANIFQSKLQNYGILRPAILTGYLRIKKLVGQIQVHQDYVAHLSSAKQIILRTHCNFSSQSIATIISLILLAKQLGQQTYHLLCCLNFQSQAKYTLERSLNSKQLITNLSSNYRLVYIYKRIINEYIVFQFSPSEYNKLREEQEMFITNQMIYIQISTIKNSTLYNNFFKNLVIEQYKFPIVLSSNVLKNYVSSNLYYLIINFFSDQITFQVNRNSFDKIQIRQLGPDGVRYDGQWKDNKACGQGKFWHVDGEIYEGEWKEDQKNGFGVYLNVNGAIYKGLWKDDLQDGNGVETWANGSKYEGSFKEGKKHGFGRLTWNDGSSYEGNWIDGKKSGSGIYCWADGKKYDGEWLNNQMHGRGLSTWGDGARYEGEYQYDKKHGQGVYIWADGRKYDGQWAYGKQSGQGKCHLLDGTVRLGLWEDGEGFRWLEDDAPLSKSNQQRY